MCGGIPLHRRSRSTDGKLRPFDKNKLRRAQETDRQSGRARAPDELRNCDLATVEERLLQVVYLEDDRSDTNWGASKETGNVGLLTAKEKNVGKWRWGGPVAVASMPRPYLANAIARSSGSDKKEEAFQTDFLKLSTDGEGNQSDEALELLTELDGPTETTDIFGRGRLRTQRVGYSPTYEYASTELSVGPLSFGRIDLGGGGP